MLWVSQGGEQGCCWPAAKVLLPVVCVCMHPSELALERAMSVH